MLFAFLHFVVFSRGRHGLDLLLLLFGLLVLFEWVLLVIFVEAVVAVLVGLLRGWLGCYGIRGGGWAFRHLPHKVVFAT